MRQGLDDKLKEIIPGYDAVVSLKISPDDYCRLAVSVRKLVRRDDKAAGLRGLEDLETGERFFIDEEDLFRPIVTRARQNLG
jgi:hypothetical protein